MIKRKVLGPIGDKEGRINSRELHDLVSQKNEFYLLFARDNSQLSTRIWYIAYFPPLSCLINISLFLYEIQVFCAIFLVSSGNVFHPETIAKCYRLLHWETMALDVRTISFLLRRIATDCCCVTATLFTAFGCFANSSAISGEKEPHTHYKNQKFFSMIQ